MFNTKVKETLCTSCIHRKVCIYIRDFTRITKAIDDLMVDQITHDEKPASKKAIEYEFISDISVGCKYYDAFLKNWVEKYRSGEAILGNCTKNTPPIMKGGNAQ